MIILCNSPDSVRELMIIAHQLNFDNGEYVFINLDPFSRLVRTWMQVFDTEWMNVYVYLCMFTHLHVRTKWVNEWMNERMNWMLNECVSKRVFDNIYKSVWRRLQGRLQMCHWDFLKLTSLIYLHLLCWWLFHRHLILLSLQTSAARRVDVVKSIICLLS